MGLKQKILEGQFIRDGYIYNYNKDTNSATKMNFEQMTETMKQAAGTGSIRDFGEKMLKEMGGSGKPAAGGVPSFKKGDVDAPPPRDYGKETRDTLEAQIQLAPQLYASEAKYRPQYADLERRMQLEQMGIDPSKGLLQAVCIVKIWNQRKAVFILKQFFIQVCIVKIWNQRKAKHCK